MLRKTLRLSLLFLLLCPLLDRQMLPKVDSTGAQSSTFGWLGYLGTINNTKWADVFDNCQPRQMHSWSL